MFVDIAFKYLFYSNGNRIGFLSAKDTLVEKTLRYPLKSLEKTRRDCLRLLIRLMKQQALTLIEI